MVPKAARAALGKSEFTRSLRTTDKRLAADRSHAFLADWKAQIDCALTSNIAEQAVGRTVVDTGLVNDLAVAVGYENASRNARELIAAKARLVQRLARNVAHDPAQLVQDRRYLIDCFEILPGRVVLGTNIQVQGEDQLIARPYRVPRFLLHPPNVPQRDASQPKDSIDQSSSKKYSA